MTTGLAVLDTSLNKTKEWLKDIQEQLGIGEEDAYAAARAVFQTLRDRLTVEESAELAAQMPMMLVGVFYDGWDPTGKPEKIRTKEAFLDLVDKRLTGRMDPEKATRVVLGVLSKRISRGEVEDIKVNLSKKLLELWPEES